MLGVVDALVLDQASDIRRRRIGQLIRPGGAFTLLTVGQSKAALELDALRIGHAGRPPHADVDRRNRPRHRQSRPCEAGDDDQRRREPAQRAHETGPANEQHVLGADYLRSFDCANARLLRVSRQSGFSDSDVSHAAAPSAYCSLNAGTTIHTLLTLGNSTNRIRAWFPNEPMCARRVPRAAAHLPGGRGHRRSLGGRGADRHHGRRRHRRTGPA